MKINILFGSILMILIAGGIILFSSTQSELKWDSFNKAIVKGQSENKKLVIDVYTDWCGWCKKMDKSTYQNQNVVDYISKKYIPVKLNAESSTKLTFEGQEYSEQQFSRNLGISGYPSTLFVDEKGKLITVVPGYLEPAEFIKILKFIGEDIYKSKSFDEYLKSLGS
ncbi:MAG: thioredoxin fold domain-containing protein [Ignavibacteriales bacterium]|nr:thioredoxin fold domain-containing protein [Ignavibacteriales bacterium]